MIGHPTERVAPPETTLVHWVGCASALAYLTAFTLRWPLWRLYERPHLDYAFLSDYTRSGQAVYLGVFALLFGLYYLAYLAARRTLPAWLGGTSPAAASDADRPAGVPLGLILGGQLVFGLLLVWIYPVAALDVYDYLMYGRVVLVHGGNPFTQPPELFADRLVGYSPWPKEPSVYGPVWQMVSLIPTALAGESLLGGLVLFKLTALAFSLGCSAAIWRLLVLSRPDMAPAGTILFAWNPLLLFEIAGNGHNDAAMVLFVLLALLALVRGPRLLVFPLFAAAVLTKLLAVALGPAVLVGLLRASGSWPQKMVWIFGGGAISLLLAVVLYAPFWEGIQTFHFLTRGNWFTASFPTMLREYFRRSMEYEEAGRAAATLAGLAFGLYVAGRLSWLWWSDRRRSGDDSVPSFAAGSSTRWDRWLSAAHDVTFAYLAFACIWWEPWYLTWLVALAALVPSRLVHDRALLFCYGGVINYVVFKYIWPVYQPMTYTQIMGLSVVLIFGLPLLHLACSMGTTARTAESEAAPSDVRLRPVGRGT